MIRNEKDATDKIAYRRIFFVMYFIKHNSKCRSIKKINWVCENVKIMEKEREQAQIEKRKSRKIGERNKKLEKDFPYGCVS